MLFGAITAYLRIGADKHYFSDVLIGSITGFLVGYLVTTYKTDHNQVDFKSNNQSYKISTAFAF